MNQSDEKDDSPTIDADDESNIRIAQLTFEYWSVANEWPIDKEQAETTTVLPGEVAQYVDASEDDVVELWEKIPWAERADGELGELGEWEIDCSDTIDDMLPEFKLTDE